MSLEAAADGARPRILLAPVTVSPTKPLTPTHLKYLLSLDMLYRATATFADVAVLYHHGTFAGCQQVAGFWAYLDECHPGCEAATEEAIGRLYAAYHRAGRPDYANIEPMVGRAEDGWIHPVSRRLLDLWEGHYRRLGLFDPQLGRGRPDLAAVDETIDLLRRRNLCIDGRPLGAPVYLDATAAGLPLRPVLSADGQSNYLLYLLRELIPKLEGYDQVVLAHDTELRADYQTVAYLLGALGATVSRFEVPRVPVDGVVKSARFGGWQGYTLDAFAGPVIGEFGPAAFRLGLRLYLVAGLGRTARQSFSAHYLRRWTRRAVRLLDQPAVPAERLVIGLYLARLAGRRGYADPYRLATLLMSREAGVPLAGLLQVVLDQDEAETHARPGGRAPVAPAPADDDAGAQTLGQAAGLNFSSTVDRKLVHRHNLTEVFLTDVRATGARSFVAAALLPIVHPHYTSHEGLAGQITDPMLLLECCRQAETYAAHACYEVDLEAAFILRSWSAEFAVDTAGGDPGPTELVMTAVTGNSRLSGGTVRGLEYEFGLWTSGTRIGRVRMDVTYAPREAYLALRSRGRAGPLPTSDPRPAAPVGRAAGPSSVGRVNATDTLLLDVVTGRHAVTATLRVPADNPSLFDHAQDHVPAMVLVEAARQLAALATRAWGGKPPHATAMVAMASSFAAYAELDQVITMTAQPCTNPASPGRRAVAVTFQQAGREISQATVVVAAISAASGPRREVSTG
jgi:hypothetical protein